jgi:hypothetical protein
MSRRRYAPRIARRCTRIARCAKGRQHQAKLKLPATSSRHLHRGGASMKGAARQRRPSSRRRAKLGEKSRRPPIHGAASLHRAAHRTEARATRTPSAKRVRRTRMKRPRTRVARTDRRTRAAHIRRTRVARIRHTCADRTVRVRRTRADRTARLLPTRVVTRRLRAHRAGVAASATEVEADRLTS